MILQSLIADGSYSWLEAYGLIVVTVALVFATCALTWATAVMARWMRREFELKTSPVLVPFGQPLFRAANNGIVITQKLANTGDCAVSLEHVDLDVSLKRKGGDTIPVISSLTTPLLLSPGNSVDAEFDVTRDVVIKLGGAPVTVDLQRLIDISLHIRSVGPTRKVEEQRWPITLK